MSKAGKFGLGLGVVLALGQAGVAHAAGQNICYDGYCDGAYVSYSVWDGTAGGYQTGCSQGNMVGSLGTQTSKGTAVAMSYHTDADFYPYAIHTVIRANRTWTHYRSDGNGWLVVINEGTWTPGTCGNAAAGAGSSLGQ